MLGPTFDEDNEKASGFRYGLGALGGIGFSNGANYLAVGTGLSINGDARGAVPAALSLPIEVNVTTWLSSRLRFSGWIRGDHFIAAKKSRRENADEFVVDEFTLGGHITLITERKIKGRKKNTVLRGPSLGCTVHRTMGASVLVLQFGLGAYIIPNVQ